MVHAGHLPLVQLRKVCKQSRTTPIPSESLSSQVSIALEAPAATVDGCTMPGTTGLKTELCRTKTIPTLEQMEIVSKTKTAQSSQRLPAGVRLPMAAPHLLSSRNLQTVPWPSLLLQETTAGAITKVVSSVMPQVAEEYSIPVSTTPSPLLLTQRQWMVKVLLKKSSNLHARPLQNSRVGKRREMRRRVARAGIQMRS